MQDTLEHKDKTYHTEWASIADIIILFDAYKALFGEDITPIEVFKSWMTKNNQMVWKVMHEDKLIGFYDLEPLSTQGIMKIEAGVGNALSMLPADIAAPEEEAWAYYIGSVGAITKSPIHRMVTWAFFMRSASNLCEERTVDVYTNPVTVDGLRLATGYGFEKMGAGPIWKAQLAQGTILR